MMLLLLKVLYKETLSRALWDIWLPINPIINTPNRKVKIKPFNIALVLTIFTNIVVLLRATVNDIYFNLRQNLLYYLVIGETVYYIK